MQGSKMKLTGMASAISAIVLAAATSGAALAAEQTWDLTTNGNANSPVTGTCVTNPASDSSLRLVQCTNTSGMTATDLHIFAHWFDPEGDRLPINPKRLDFDPISVAPGTTYFPPDWLNIVYGRDEHLDAVAKGLELKVYGYWTPPVPEPESYALAFTGLALLAFRGSRRFERHGS